MRKITIPEVRHEDLHLHLLPRQASRGRNEQRRHASSFEVLPARRKAASSGLGARLFQTVGVQIYRWEEPLEPEPSKAEGAAGVAVYEAAAAGLSDPSPSPPEKIEITVIDKDARELFTCSRRLLLGSMGYFRAQIGPTEGHFAVTIHASIEVFAWILAYLQQPALQLKKIALSNVVSLLVSAHHLQVPPLREACVRFISLHFEQVNALQVDFSTLHPLLLRQIAAAVPLDKLLSARERPNKLLAALLEIRVEALLESSSPAAPRQPSPSLYKYLRRLAKDRGSAGGPGQGQGAGAGGWDAQPKRPDLGLNADKFGVGCGSGSLIERCKNCRKLVNWRQIKEGKCESSVVAVEYRGSASHAHSRDPSFKQKQLLDRCREELRRGPGSGSGCGWKSVFWSLWALKQTFHCERCGAVFNGRALGGCAFHPSEARFPSQQQNEGRYPCCGAKALKFDPFRVERAGCFRQDHSPREARTAPGLLARLKDNAHHIFPPAGGAGGAGPEHPAASIWKAIASFEEGEGGLERSEAETPVFRKGLSRRGSFADY